MNYDFSHPPQIIPKMMESLIKNGNCMIVASRYAKGSSVKGRTFLRRVFSAGAVKILEHAFNLKIRDPISRYIAFPKQLIDDISIDRNGYALT